MLEGARIEREEPTEPADVADHLGPEGRAHVLLDELDGPFARRDVDARARVREWIVAAALAALPPGHGARHRGAGAELAAVSSSSASLESVDGTGTG